MIDPKTGKVVPSVFKDMTLDEISFVDRPAQPGATMSILKMDRDKRLDTKVDDEEVSDDSLQGIDTDAKPEKEREKQYSKRAFLTTATDGHTHTLTNESGPDQRAAAGVTSMADGHTHPWILNLDTGAITIGEAMGHTHALNINGQDGKPPGIIDLAPGTGLAKAEQVEDGTPDPSETSKNDSGESADMVGNVQKEDTVSDTNDKAADQVVAKQLEEAIARMERAEKVSELSDAQKGIFKSLDVEKQDEFLALTPDQREAEVTKAAEANSVVYTDRAGSEYRKNDDPRLVALAKRADAEAEAREATEKRLVEQDLRKRAEELSNLAGTIEDHVAFVKACDALGAEEGKRAFDMAKAQSASIAPAFESLGTKAGETTGSALDTIAKRFLEADPSLTQDQAIAKALETPEGEKAYWENA